MNVTVYPESYDWLFAQRAPEHHCVWSFGRHQPPVEIGDDLVFRVKNQPVARALCRAIFKPGEFNVPMHDGSRELKGWKTLWYQMDFEDLRPLKLNAMFGVAPTDRMLNALRNHDEDGWLTGPPTNQSTIGLEIRGLVELHPGLRARLTYEGLRLLHREINDQRAADIEADEVFGSSMACRVCGCTEQSGCAEGCGWVDVTGPPHCTACDELMAQLSITLPEEVV